MFTDSDGFVKSFYSKIIKSKFFNKMLISYSVIILCVVLLLVFIVTDRISAILKDQAVRFNIQILQSVDEYFYDKCKNVKDIMKDFHRNNSTTYIVNDVLKDRQPDNESESYIKNVMKIQSFMNEYFLPSDPDINSFYIIKKQPVNYYVGSRNIVMQFSQPYIKSLIEEIRNSTEIKPTSQRIFYLTSAKSDPSVPSPRQFHIYDFIRDNKDSSKIIGYLLLSFDVECMQMSFSRYESQMLSTVAVLTNQGEVLYDSTGKYYEKEFPYLGEITDTTKTILYKNDSIINIKRNELFDFIVVGMIPKSRLYQELNSINAFIWITALISLVCIILLTVYSTKKFSRRVEKIIGYIKKIQNGNLNVIIPVKGINDEVDEIASSMNAMTEKLSDHIKMELNNRVKLNEALLRQKTADLFALQAQINPHFLYNTLEAIRMKAVSMGDSDVGKMVKILAGLFRNSIKKNMVVLIKEELKYCESYLELYQIRYGNRLKVIFDIEDEILEYSIIMHLIQPLIENALVHGFNPNRENNLILIKGAKYAERIMITVIDNGIGIENERLEELNLEMQSPIPGSHEGRIGIVNVNSRIKLFYGDDYALELKSKHGEGTEAKIIIPVKTKEELESYVQGNAGR